MATSARKTRKTEYIVASISAVAVIVAALIGIYPSLKHRSAEIVIAGIVVNQDTNQGIGQATIVLAGRTEEYVTEDTGNFRIEVKAGSPKRIRLHVTKPGFQPLDTSVEPPAENLVLQLRKQ
jgi:Carboxypeptidase regulatory-like domain